MEIKSGDVVLSLDPKMFSDIFYEVLEVGPTKTDTANWVKMVGKNNKEVNSWPLFLIGTKFMKVEQSTVEVLFGAKKNGNKEKPNKNNAKSLRSKNKQRASKKL